MNGLRYQHTRIACYIGYITQAIINNFAPLLFLTFQSRFGVTLGQLTLLITLNFGVQLLVDLASTAFVDRIGYKTTAVLAHLLCFTGLASLGLLPNLLSNAYNGLIIATCLCAMGGGLIEVIISPMIEALPSNQKAASMSLLHSFYCWGLVLVVILSTLFFQFWGTGNWEVLALLWSLLPLCNSLLFALVPLRPLVAGDESQLPLKQLFTSKYFLILLLLMVCAGASEQAMSQWASFFAEVGLGVSKTMGDLLGPCLFAVLMGLSRIYFGLQKSSYSIEKLLMGSGLLCIFSYLLTVFSPYPLLSLVGCAICGLSVGVMWPGTFSLTARHYPKGGTAMFAILALAGDLGCSSGPTLVGGISNWAQQMAKAPGETALKTGLLAAVAFPLLLAVGTFYLRRATKRL